MVPADAISGRKPGSANVIFRLLFHWSEIAVLMRWRHTHGGIDWWWWSRTVGSASRTRIVLASAPAETNAGVTNRVALHLIDSHLCGVTLDELDKATALPRRNLDVGDLAEALEEGAQLIFRNVSRKSSNKDGSIIRIGELVHGLLLLLLAVERHWGSSHGWWVHWSPTTWHAHSTRTSWTALVLWSCRRDAHGSISAVNTLHLTESSLLVNFI
jgi:hypothetical protein